MLFRARRGLKDEFDDIATGERCRRMHAVIAAMAEGLGGARDRQALSRHVRFCTGCRREATAMGLEDLVAEALRRGKLRRAMHRAAALFPIPPFLRRRTGANGDSLLERLGARLHAPMSSLGAAAGPAAEQAAGTLSKVAAVVAAAALIGGGGLAGKSSNDATAAGVPAPAAGALEQLGTAAASTGSLASAAAAVDPFGRIGGSPQAGGTSPARTGVDPSGTLGGQAEAILRQGGTLGATPVGGEPTGSNLIDQVTAPLQKQGIALPKLRVVQDAPSLLGSGGDGSTLEQLPKKITDTVAPVLPKTTPGGHLSVPSPSQVLQGPSSPSTPSAPSVPDTGLTTPDTSGTAPSSLLSTDGATDTVQGAVDGATQLQLPLR
jgi:hypothetical protein